MLTLILPHKNAPPSVVLYDEQDALIVKDRSWSLHTGGYVIGSLRGPGARLAVNEYLHRLIMQPQGKLIIDHINGDKLDNRRCNLRIVGYGHNNLNQRNRLRSDNTHGFRGVALHRPSGRWQARLTVAGKRHNLGYHDTAAEAHAAYLRGVAALSPSSLDAGLR